MDMKLFLPLGIPEIDAALGGGLPVGDVTLLAGAAEVGKTGFCVARTIEWAQRGHSVTFLTLDERRYSIEARLEAVRARLGAPEATLDRITLLEENVTIFRVPEPGENRPLVVDDFGPLVEHANAMKMLRDWAAASGRPLLLVLPFSVLTGFGARSRLLCQAAATLEITCTGHTRALEVQRSRYGTSCPPVLLEACAP